jgi:hypothetical protein
MECQIIARYGDILTLSRPWRTMPNAGSTVVLSELNYRNLILNNTIHNAMSGIEFWINGIQNVIAGNHLSDLDREGILLFSNALGGPQSQTPFWPIGDSNMAGFNRGIGPSYFNTVESNTVENALIGISVAAGDFRTASGPIKWPLSMGDVVRFNVMNTMREAGVRVAARLQAGDVRRVPGASLVGNMVEDNSVKDAPKAYFGDQRAKGLSIIGNRVGVTAKPATGREAPLELPTVVEGWVIQGNNFVVPRVATPEVSKGGASVPSPK